MTLLKASERVPACLSNSQLGNSRWFSNNSQSWILLEETGLGVDYTVGQLALVFHYCTIQKLAPYCWYGKDDIVERMRELNQPPTLGPRVLVSFSAQKGSVLQLLHQVALSLSQYWILEKNISLWFSEIIAIVHSWWRLYTQHWKFVAGRLFFQCTKEVQFGFAHFMSHFIRVQIFQIDFPPILSAFKYFRYNYLAFYICRGQNEHFSINLVRKKWRVEPFLNETNFWCKELVHRYLENNICNFKSPISPWR